MSDVFENVSMKFKNTPSALVLFWISFLMLIVGLNHMLEDVYSSYLGLISLEQHYRLQVQIYDWTYWTMSASMQIASIVFFYVYLANTNKGWALWVAVGSQATDFLADLWYRSNGAMFKDWDVTVVGAIITFVFFTVGSEMFITFGAGLCLKLAAPSLHSWKYVKAQIDKVKQQFERGGVPKNYSEERAEREPKPHNKPSFRPVKPNKPTFSPGFLDKLNRKPEKSLHRVNSEENESYDA